MNSRNLLTIDQISFVRWYVSPKQERIDKKLPLTIEQYAQSVKLNPKTLYMWLRLPEFSLAIAAATVEWGFKQLPAVFKALFENAQGPKGAKDRETIVKHLLPNISKIQLDMLTPDAKSKTGGRPTARVWQEQFKDLTFEERSKFMPILEAMGKIEPEPEPIQLEADADDDNELVTNLLDVEPYYDYQAPQLAAPSPEPEPDPAHLAISTGQSTSKYNPATRKSTAQGQLQQRRKKRPNSPK